jgi:hypothetical protein
MFGSYSKYLKPLKDLDRREFIVLFTLLLPTVIFGFWPNLILESLHLTVSNLIYSLPVIETTTELKLSSLLLMTGVGFNKKLNFFSNLEHLKDK